MAPPENNRNKRMERRTEKDSDYLFHVQRRDISSDHKHNPTKSDSVEQTFLKNVRIFAITIGLMIVFLVIAVEISKQTWRLKERRMTENLPTQKETPALIASHPALENVGEDTALSIGTGPDPDTLYEANLLVAQADSLVASSNYEEAVEIYEEALKVWPNHTRVQADLGRLQLQLGNLRAAEHALRRASKMTPLSIDLQNDLGVVYFKQHRLSRAEKTFEEAIRENPDYAPALYNLALCRRVNGDRPGAQQMLDRYLALRPNDPHGLKEKAFFTATSGQYAGAIEILNQAISLAPDWAPLYFDAAATAALMGKVSDAINYLGQAEARSSPFAVYLVYQQPAFAETRASQKGKDFLSKLIRRAQNTPMKGNIEKFRLAGPEPIISFQPQ